MRLLLGHQLRVDRQGQRFFGRTLGLWEVSLLICEGTEAFLEMKGYRVIDLGPDPSILHLGQQ
jgi:hypothetical protein